MTTGLFTRSEPTTAPRFGGLGKTVRTPVALPSDVADAQRSVTVRTAAPTRGPAHAKPLAAPLLGAGGAERRKLWRAVGGLGVIFLVLVLSGVVARHVHLTPVTPAPASTAATHATAAATPAEVNRLQDATTDAMTATAGLHDVFSTISGTPTTTEVAHLTGPYVDTLQLYETMLAGTPAPATAAASLHTLKTQLHDDIATFGTADSVKSENLGAFITTLFARSATLQTAMSQFAHSLRDAGSH